MHRHAVACDVVDGGGKTFADPCHRRVAPSDPMRNPKRSGITKSSKPVLRIANRLRRGGGCPDNGLGSSAQIHRLYLTHPMVDAARSTGSIITIVCVQPTVEWQPIEPRDLTPPGRMQMPFERPPIHPDMPAIRQPPPAHDVAQHLSHEGQVPVVLLLSLSPRGDERDRRRRPTAHPSVWPFDHFVQ